MRRIDGHQRSYDNSPERRKKLHPPRFAPLQAPLIHLSSLPALRKIVWLTFRALEGDETEYLLPKLALSGTVHFC